MTMKELDAMMEKLWDEVSIEERKDVCKCYNKFYNDEDHDLPFEQLNESFSGSRWITIKYTFGVEPVK